MSINFRSLQVNLATVIKELTSQVVVWSNQNTNTKDGDHLILNITSIRIIGGTDWEGPAIAKGDGTFAAKTQGDREIVLSIQSISKNCMEILLDLVNKLNFNSTLRLLGSKKFAFVGLDGDIANITVQVNNSFETRAAVDLVFRISKNYSAASEDAVGIIESIGIEGTLGGNGVEDPVDINMTVDSTE
jgi:hypothetical protein